MSCDGSRPSLQYVSLLGLHQLCAAHFGFLYALLSAVPVNPSRLVVAFPWVFRLSQLLGMATKILIIFCFAVIGVVTRQ